LKIYLCSDINSFGLINWKSSIIISIGWVPSKIFKLVGAHLILHQNSMKAKFVEAEEMLVFFDLESELQEVNIPLNNSTYLWYPAERNQQQASITSSSEYTVMIFGLKWAVTRAKSAILTLNFVFRIACFGDLQSFWIKVSLLEWNRIERPNVNFYFIKIEPNLIKYRLVGAGKDKSGPDNRNLRKKVEKAFGQLRQSLNPKVNLCKNFKMQSQFSTRNENIPNISIPKNHKSYSKFLKSDSSR